MRVAGKSDGSGNAWAYVYDHQGHLLAGTYTVLGGAVSQRVTYVYDAFGNRIERSAWNGSTTVERFAVDGWDTAKPGAVGTENFDVWADLSGSNTLSARRVMGGEFDQVLAKVAGSVVTWYGVDRQGSVRQILDNSGSVIASSEFDGYGNLIAGSLVDRYGYTGREWDSALGLYYSRARMYSPTIGRFLSEDPLAFAAGDANLYRYVGNEPTNGTDPSGTTLFIEPQDRRKWQSAVDKLFVRFGEQTAKGYIPLEVTEHGREIDRGQGPGSLNFHDSASYIVRRMNPVGNDRDEAVKEAMIALFDGRVDSPLPSYTPEFDRVIIHINKAAAAMGSKNSTLIIHPVHAFQDFEPIKETTDRASTDYWDPQKVRSWLQPNSFKKEQINQAFEGKYALESIPYMVPNSPGRDDMFKRYSYLDVPSDKSIRVHSHSHVIDPVVSAFTEAELARIRIRVNLLYFKGNIVDRVYAQLMMLPPTGPGSVQDPIRYAEAANELADSYIRAVDAFLQKHYGARPKQGTRAGYFGYQINENENEITAPWCADWAKGVYGSIKKDEATKWKSAKNMFSIFWMQWRRENDSGVSFLSGAQQHNFVGLFPNGRSIMCSVTQFSLVRDN